MCTQFSLEIQKELKVLILKTFLGKVYLIRFIVVLLVAQAWYYRKNESLQLFYKIKSNKVSTIYISKVVVSRIIVTLRIIFGDLCAVYIDWALFGGV